MCTCDCVLTCHCRRAVWYGMSVNGMCPASFYYCCQECRKQSVQLGYSAYGMRSGQHGSSLYYVYIVHVLVQKVQLPQVSDAGKVGEGWFAAFLLSSNGPRADMLWFQSCVL
eukprot:scpid107947/ scgid11979/ 